MRLRPPREEYDLFGEMPPRGARGGDTGGADTAAPSPEIDDLTRAMDNFKRVAEGAIPNLKRRVAEEAVTRLYELGVGNGEVPLDVLERIRDRDTDALAAVREYFNGFLLTRYGPEFVFDAVISDPDVQRRLRECIAEEEEREERMRRERDEARRREAEERERVRLAAEERTRAAEAERIRRAEEEARRRREEDAARIRRAEEEARRRREEEAARTREWASRAADFNRQVDEFRSPAMMHGLNLGPINDAIRDRDARRTELLIDRARKVIGVHELLARDSGITLGAYERDFVQAIRDILQRDDRSWAFFDDASVNEVYETHRQWQSWQREFIAAMVEIDATIAFVHENASDLDLTGIVGKMEGLREGLRDGSVEVDAGMQELSDVITDMYRVVRSVEGSAGKRFVPPGGARGEGGEKIVTAKEAADALEKLGLKTADPKTVTAEHIKRAFRRLVVQYHPDKNPGDKAAEEMFKKISEANGNLQTFLSQRDKSA